MDGFSNFDWFANSRMFIGGKSPGFRNFSALALHRDGWGKNNWWKLVNLHLQPVALLLHITLVLKKYKAFVMDAEMVLI